MKKADRDVRLIFLNNYKENFTLVLVGGENPWKNMV